MYEEENFVWHKIKEWWKEYSTSPLENDMLSVISSIYSFQEMSSEDRLINLIALVSRVHR